MKFVINFFIMYTNKQTKNKILMRKLMSSFLLLLLFFFFLFLPVLFNIQISITSFILNYFRFSIVRQLAFCFIYFILLFLFCINQSLSICLLCVANNFFFECMCMFYFSVIQLQCVSPFVRINPIRTNIARA